MKNAGKELSLVKAIKNLVKFALLELPGQGEKEVEVLSRLTLALKDGRKGSQLGGRGSSHQSSRQNHFTMRLIAISLVFLLVIGGFVSFHAKPVKATPSDLYWRGTGNFSDATKWYDDPAAGSNGYTPDATSNVHFNAASFSGVGQSVDTSGVFSVKDMDWTGALYMPTLYDASGTSTITIYGNLTFISGMYFNNGGGTTNINFAGSTANTITTAGKSFRQTNPMSFNGTGSWTFQDDFTITGSNGIQLVAGSLDFNDKTVTIPSIRDSSTSTRSWDFGSSSIYLTSSGIYNFDIDSATGLAFNAGTSTLYITNGSMDSASGLTFNNIVENSIGADGVGFDDTNTISNLTVNGGDIADACFTFRTSQTITGTLTLNGYSASRRLSVFSNTLHTQRTVTAATVSATNTLFRDIVGSGAGSWDFSARNDVGNCGGNSGITFSPSRNVYATQIPGNVNWSNISNWADATNGTPGTSVRGVPLPQDMAIFDAYSVPTPGTIIAFDVSHLSGLNTLTATNNPQFNGTTDYFYNSLILGTCIWNVTTSTYMYGQTAQTLQGDFSYGTCDFYIDLQGGSMSQSGALTVASTNTIYLTSGVWVTNGYAVTTGGFNSSTTTYPRALWMGNGAMTSSSTFTLNSIAAITKWNVASTNLNIDCIQSTIILTNSGTNGQTFTGGGMTYYNVYVQGAGAYTLTLGSAFTIASGGTFYVDRSVANKTIAGNYTVTIPTATGLSMPASGTRTVTITNTDFSIARGTVSVQYMSISGSAASGGALYFAGATPPSVDGGGNSGWIFSAPYLVVQTMTASGATLNGNISGLGGTSAQNRGFIWNGASMTTPNAATAPSASGYSNWAEGAGAYGEGNFSKASGVATAGTWYFMAAAQDASNNWYYGAELTFTYVTPVAGTGTMPSSNNTMIGYLATFNGTLPSQYNNVNLFTRNIMDYVNTTALNNSGFYSENMNPSTFGASYINTMLDAGNWPRSLFWFPFVFFLSIITGFFVYKFSHSLLTQACASALILGLFSAAGIVPAWTIAIFCVEALAVLIAQKQNGWG